MINSIVSYGGSQSVIVLAEGSLIRGVQVKQEVVLCLLEELASEDCATERFTEIMVYLRDAVQVPVVPDSYNDDSRDLCIRILDNVLQQANSSSNRSHIRGLFPLVAMLCGDHPRHNYFANIDWSLLA